MPYEPKALKPTPKGVHGSVSIKKVHGYIGPPRHGEAPRSAQSPYRYIDRARAWLRGVRGRTWAVRWVAPMHLSDLCLKDTGIFIHPTVMSRAIRLEYRGIPYRVKRHTLPGYYSRKSSRVEYDIDYILTGGADDAIVGH